jgi:hypothetical protein
VEVNWIDGSLSHLAPQLGLALHSRILPLRASRLSCQGWGRHGADKEGEVDMDDQTFQRDLASYQQEQDFLKHLVTLSTGCILLMVTFLEKLFHQPKWKFLVVVSLVSFGVSIIGSLTTHVLSVLNIDSAEDKSLGTGMVLFGILCVVLSFGGFLTGLAALVVFGTKNIY